METALAERKQTGGMMEVASSRQAQEVQAAMVIAQRFPRDTTKALTRVLEDCKRKSLAEKALYSYPRGGQTVTGPSIRLAEAVAKAYGNLDFGVIELEKKQGLGNVPGESTLMSYCWDLETNTRSTKVFTVAHKRDTRDGSKKLTDERDIYEISANNGARRLRACILSVIPADIVEAAVEQCRKTMKSNVGPLIDKIREMVLGFKGLGVSQEMLEKYLGHQIDLTNHDEIVELQGVFNSIRDGLASREDFFEMGTPPVNADAGTQDQAPPVAAKSVGSIKNHAPQTPEEAEARAKEVEAKMAKEREFAKAEAAAQEATKQADESAKNERATAVMALLNEQRRLKYTNEVFKTEIKTLTGKELNQLTTAEITNLGTAFSQRTAKEAEGAAHV